MSYSSKQSPEIITPVTSNKEKANAIITNYLDFDNQIPDISKKAKMLSSIKAMQKLQDKLKKLPDNPDTATLAETLNPANSYKDYLVTKLNLPEDFDFEQEFKNIHAKQSSFSKKNRELILKLEEMQQQSKNRTENVMDQGTKDFLVDIIKRIHEKDVKNKKEEEKKEIEKTINLVENIDDMRQTMDEAVTVLKESIEENKTEKGE